MKVQGPSPTCDGQSQTPQFPSPTSQPSPRWWDWLAALLLLSALLFASGRLVTTRWTDHLLQTQTLAFLAALAGMALGYSRFSPLVAFFFASVYGLFFIPWQLGLTIPEALSWNERLLILSDRLRAALFQLAAHQDVLDPLPFLLLMDGLFWAMGAWAGYSLTRWGDPWRATIPPGVAMLVIQAYDPYPPSRAGMIALYLFFALLLWARTTYLHQRAKWQATRTYLAPFLGMDITRVAAIFALGLVILAWVVPPPAEIVPSARRAWNRLTHAWTIVQERLEPLFASLQGSGGVAATDYYGPRMSLGLGSERQETVILRVKAPPDLPAGVRLYWRARVYDYYADGEWQATFPTDLPVAATDEGILFPGRTGRLPEWTGRWTGVFTYTTVFPISVLYFAPQPVWVDVPVQADLADGPNGTIDLAALKASPLLAAGATYRARSALSVVTVAQLRAAGTDYPEWVTARYLQVPDTITPRTRELARQIAAGRDNPYDIAAAVTDYLRANIRYTQTVPPLPRGREPLDWFLFDLRRGFCNYFASAEVILLRSLGIPARLAVGFTTGKPEGETYTVRDKDAHAWPEVYFPGIGWVEFEPTASQPPLIRPSGEERPAAETGLSPGETARLAGLRRWEREKEIEEMGTEETKTSSATPLWRSALSWALLSASAALLLYLGWRTRFRLPLPLPVLLERGMERVGIEPPGAVRRWADQAMLPPVARAYMELNRALARLGAPPSPAETPAERGARLVGLLPETAPWVSLLLSEYQAAVYGPGIADHRAALQAGRALRRISWQSRLANIGKSGRFAPR